MSRYDDETGHLYSDAEESRIRRGAFALAFGLWAIFALLDSMGVFG